MEDHKWTDGNVKRVVLSEKTVAIVLSDGLTENVFMLSREDVKALSEYFEGVSNNERQTR